MRDEDTRRSLRSWLLDQSTPIDSGEEGRNTAAILLNFVGLVVVVILSLSLLHFFLLPNGLLIGSWWGSAILVSLCLPIYRLTARLDRAGTYLIGISVVCISWISLWTGGVRAPSLFWLNTLPLVAALLIGSRRALVFALIVWLCVLAFTCMDQWGLGPQTLLDRDGFLIHTLQTLLGMLAFYLLVTFTYLRQISSDLDLLRRGAERTQQLIRVVCHDLGTPLLVIRGRVEVLDSEHPTSVELSRGGESLSQILDELREENRNAVALIDGRDTGSLSGPLEKGQWPAFFRFFEPDEATPAQRGNARLLVLTTGLCFLMTIVFATVGALAQEPWALRLIWLGFGVSYLSGAYVYKRLANLRLAASLFVALALVAIVVMSWRTGGLFSPTLYWLPLAPIVVAMLAGGAEVFVSAAVCVAIVLGFGLQQSMGAGGATVLTPHLHTIHLVQTMLGSGALTLVVAAAYLWRTGRTRHALEEGRDTNQRLVRQVCVDLADELGRLRGHLDAAPGSLVDDRARSALQRALGTMAQIVESVRHLNRQLLRDGEPESVPVDPVGCVEELVLGFESRLAENEQSLIVDDHLGVGRRVRFVDAQSLTHQVLGNLIGNAIKFSPNGSELHLSMRERGGWVELQLRDQGRGIPEERLEHLFRADVGGSTPGLRGEKGTGYGLPIAKSYVDMSGGEIFVETKTGEGAGTTFTIRLPAA